MATERQTRPADLGNPDPDPRSEGEQTQEVNKSDVKAQRLSENHNVLFLAFSNCAATE